VVNVPAAAVVAPSTVELIPVAVVLKFPDVNIRLLAPVEIEDADKPDNVIAPDVPVILIAPVVSVNPLLALSNPAEVIVPVPVVEIFPDVVITSPAVVGDKVVPVLFQNPKFPDVGAVVVS
jgi:hypothetical protein